MKRAVVLLELGVVVVVVIAAAVMMWRWVLLLVEVAVVGRAVTTMVLLRLVPGTLEEEALTIQLLHHGPAWRRRRGLHHHHAPLPLLQAQLPGLWCTQHPLPCSQPQPTRRRGMREGRGWVGCMVAPLRWIPLTPGIARVLGPPCRRWHLAPPGRQLSHGVEHLARLLVSLDPIIPTRGNRPQYRGRLDDPPGPDSRVYTRP